MTHTGSVYQDSRFRCVCVCVCVCACVHMGDILHVLCEVYMHACVWCVWCVRISVCVYVTLYTF